MSGPLSHHSSVEYNDKMYVYGGSYNFNCNTTVYCLNLLSFVWTKIKTKPEAGEKPIGLDEHTAVLYNGKMVIFGGFKNGYRSNQVHELDLHTFKWNSVTVSGD